MVAEAGGEPGKLLTGGIERRLGLPLQRHAPQLHLQQLGREDALLGGIEGQLASPVLLLKPLEGLVHRAALTGAVAEGHHSRLLALMCFAQLWAVADAIEMADHSPAPAQALAQPLQGIHHLRPAQGFG